MNIHAFVIDDNCKRCSEAVPTTGHVCHDAIPLYGTDQWDQLDPRTIEEYEKRPYFRPLRECQAWRWGDPDRHICGDAIVTNSFAVIRVGDKIMTIHNSNMHFNLAQKLAGIDHLIFMHPIF